MTPPSKKTTADNDTKQIMTPTTTDLKRRFFETVFLEIWMDIQLLF
jgi:hypothetical protein